MTGGPAHPFEKLVSPLRYATENNFSRLKTVRGLRPLLENVVKTARAGGVPPDVLFPLEREVPVVDSADEERRRAGLRRLIECLKAVGVWDQPLPVSPPAAGKGRTARLPVDIPVSSEKRASTRSLRVPARGSSPAGPLSQPLKGLSLKWNPRLRAVLNKRGIETVGDVLFTLPRAYEDRRQIQTIDQLIPGERGTTVAVVREAKEEFLGGRRRVFRVLMVDATGVLALTFFHSGPWMKGRFPVGKSFIVSGDVKGARSVREIVHPEVEPADDAATSSVHSGAIIPVYPGFERHEQRGFRELAAQVAAQVEVPDPLSAAMRAELNLDLLSVCIRQLHSPSADVSLDLLNARESRYHHRLAFDELFFIQLGLALRRRGIQVQKGHAFAVTSEKIARAKKIFPFELTRAQHRVITDVADDMRRDEPMLRLIQGDVGSGKTAVALVSAVLALGEGKQVAVMAPTEILAAQHQRTFAKLLGPVGYRVALLSSGLAASEKAGMKRDLAKGEIHVAVGTHALIQAGVDFQSLGLVVVDEQHRFGVMQRQALMQKGVCPDVMVMTATPIPRTLAMTLYGDLALSVIDELPPGRTPVHTKVYGEKRREKVYEAVAAQLSQGRQCYVVYPLVEASEKVDLQDATQGAADLKLVFPKAEIGLLHGRMTNAEKDAVMAKFRANEIHVLVSTTVIEVGVDVPNATVMVIEGAERFGLSQLHQLRGRVGRGAQASYCFLVATAARSAVSSERLSIMEQSTDGFVIAEKDLELRGPGEFLGTRQSGLPELAVADLVRDGDLVSIAQREARRIVDQDPELKDPVHLPLRKALEDRWEGRLALSRVG